MMLSNASGPGHTLTLQTTQSARAVRLREKLTVVGPPDRIEGVRVLGPTRPKCQIEVSRTDEFKLGIDANYEILETLIIHRGLR